MMISHRDQTSLPTGVIDFQGVAGLIDTVAGADPGRLRLLFQVLRSSDECLEARVVVDLALRCRDPLAPLATLCRDALKAASDFDLLLRSAPWSSVRERCPGARATALLNLCDGILAAANPRKRKRRLRCRQVRPRLKIAAVEEQDARAEAIERVEAQRLVQCPDYWQLLRVFLAGVLADRA